MRFLLLLIYVKIIFSSQPSQFNKADGKLFLETECNKEIPPDFIDISNLDISTFIDNKNAYICGKEYTSRIAFRGCKVLTYNSIFTGMESTKDGGAVYLVRCQDFEYIVENCQFIKCKGSSGAAIYAKIDFSLSVPSYIKVTNTIFKENTIVSDGQDDTNGGALYLDAVTASFYKCKFINNVAIFHGDDIYLTFSIYDGLDVSISIDNCIFENTQNLGLNNEALVFDMFINLQFTFTNNIINYTGESSFLSTVQNPKIQSNLHGNCLVSENKMVLDSLKNNGVTIPDGDFTVCKVEVPTELPTLDPSIKLCYYTSDGQNIPLNDRCELDEVDTSKAILIHVVKDTFENALVEGPGAAVHVKNCGVECKNTKFINCSSNSGGGAVYVKNSLELENSISLENLQFNRCKAVYGGAVYIYTRYESVKVNLISCSFNSNEIIEGSSDSNLFGGSSLYITSANAEISDCTFRNGKGKGGHVKITQNFDNEDHSKLLNLQKNSILIENCHFDQFEEDSCSIYYIVGKDSGFIDIKNSVFSGDISKRTTYIDGEMNSNSTPKIRISSCKFDRKIEDAVNIKMLSQIDYSKKNDIPVTFWILLGLTGMMILAVIVSLLVLKLKNKNSNEVDEQQDNLQSLNLI